MLPILSTEEGSFSVILGGGFGWLTAQHGLAIDNLVEVRVERATALCVPNISSFIGHFDHCIWRNSDRECNHKRRSLLGSTGGRRKLWSRHQLRPQAASAASVRVRRSCDLSSLHARPCSLSSRRVAQYSIAISQCQFGICTGTRWECRNYRHSRLPWWRGRRKESLQTNFRSR